MTRLRLVLVAAALFAAGCAFVADRSGAPPATRTLTLAAWNVEHLAERNGSGCRPREDADYAALRAYVQALDADVIAFQEVESQAAAERVFDPAEYAVLIEERRGNPRGACRGRPGLSINAQRTGFAVRRTLAFERLPDVTALQLGEPNLRSGVDVIVRPAGAQPLRLLSVHLKSGCSSRDVAEACPVLFRQVPQLEAWIDRRAAEALPFAVLGDFNRRLAMPGDAVWADWDDASPANADLLLTSAGRPARCNPRYADFIDHIVLDRRATAGFIAFDEQTYDAQPLSDHCAISAVLDLRD